MLMLIHLAAVVLLTLSDIIPRSPAIDATCAGSNFFLGTGNVPQSNDPATNIVNVWAVLREDQTPPLAWIAKNASNQYWIQVNGNEARYIRAAFPSKQADSLLTGLSPKPKSVSIPMQIESLDAFATDFRRVNAKIEPCFTHDLT